MKKVRNITSHAELSGKYLGEFVLESLEGAVGEGSEVMILKPLGHVAILSAQDLTQRHLQHIVLTPIK